MQIYPASVVKLFYLGAVHRWLEDSKLQDTDELRRATRDMIVQSYNEATHYIVDVLTGTTSGPELPPSELKKWITKRDAVNRYFASLGYTNINVNKKPWCEGPYGRETQAIKSFKPGRNLLTTDATARLLTEIVTGKAVSSKRCAEMMELLKRDPSGKSDDPDDQAHGFTGRALPHGAKLWSKAGWTSETRHDAAYIELPNVNLDNGRETLSAHPNTNRSRSRATHSLSVGQFYVEAALQMPSFIQRIKQIEDSLGSLIRTSNRFLCWMRARPATAPRP